MQIDFAPFYDYLVGLEPGWLILAGIAIGACLAVIVTARIARRQRDDAFEAGLQASAAQHAEQLYERDDQVESLSDEVYYLRQQDAANQAAHASALGAIQTQLHEQQAELAQKREQLSTALTQAAAAQARLEEAGKSFEEKEQLFKETSTQLKQEFELLANRVFELRARNIRPHCRPSSRHSRTRSSILRNG